MTSTTRTMTRCSCFVTPSWRQCFCPLCRRLTSSPSRSLAGSPRHLHLNPTGLPRGLRRSHPARPRAGGSGLRPASLCLPLARWVTSLCSVFRRCDHREGFRGLTRVPAEHLYTPSILGLSSRAEPSRPQPTARVDAHVPEPRSLARLL